MCPYAGLPARTTALACRCLLSSGSRVRILPGALIKSPAQPVYAPTGDWPSCLVPPSACHFCARCLLGSIGSAECRAGGLADRISEHPLPLVGRVQVDQCSSCAAMAHAVHQFAQVRALVGEGEGVSGMPQVMKMDTRRLYPKLDIMQASLQLRSLRGGGFT